MAPLFRRQPLHEYRKVQNELSAPSPYVFPADSASGHMSPPNKRWKKLLIDADLTDLRLHDLRRSLGSWAAMTGASLAVIGRALGHKSTDATAVYARLQHDPVTEAMERATAAMLSKANITAVDIPATLPTAKSEV
jgi:integrase